MRTLVIIIIVGCYLTSCAGAGINLIPKQTIIIGIDLTKYSEKGFLITPGEYGEDYVSIGMFRFSVFPSAEKITIPKRGAAPYTQRTEWKTETIDLQEVMNLAYETAIAKNANAITHLKIESIHKTYANTVTIDAIEVSGLLIRRK